MSRGGFRAGSGRKKGFAAIEAEKSREYIAQRVSESLEPIMDALIMKAEKGDIYAIRELFDRAYGKSIQTAKINQRIESNTIVFRNMGED